ncbi:NUDIX domain-containing protein [Bacillus sp. 03113]|uniref:NUDIX domain-containing protein n=1 Tax=Bacillus sp. 03113 TaxID=2578211 RepID=UPI001143CAD9|nr:NUDIX domain-containing protein [Bacillus sp. 03113]
MSYCDEMRKMIGTSPLIIVRPSVVIINQNGEILLNRYADEEWMIPGGILQLDETVEDCLKRNAKDDIGITLHKLNLFGVYSGNELYTRTEDGDEYYNVAIGYICTEYEGEIMPDQNQAIEAKFFKVDDLPVNTNPFIQKKIVDLKMQLKNFLNV